MALDKNLVAFVVSIVMFFSFWVAWILLEFVLPRSESTLLLGIGCLACIFFATRAVVKKEVDRP